MMFPPRGDIGIERKQLRKKHKLGPFVKNSKRKMTLTIPCTSSVPRGATARVRPDRVDTVLINCARVLCLPAFVEIC